MSSRAVTVAVPVPLYRSFDYSTAGVAGGHDLTAGQRVRVPFGRRELTGVVLGAAPSAGTSGRELRPLASVLDESPLFPAELLELCKWAADYYQHPLGEVLANALPGALRHRGQAQLDCPPIMALTEAGSAALGELPARSRALRALLERLQSSPLPAQELADLRAALRSATQRKWVEARQVTPVAPAISGAPPPPLTPEQSLALQALQQAGDRAFSATLLHGVTGSGKTELYLRRAAEVLAQGRQVLVLAPEIGLTPQLGERFAERFGAGVTVYHSAMAAGERTQAWLRARAGLAPVVVGTRSAAWLPFANLGLIIVDEEHDGSYKQQDGLRYSARDLLLLRAQRLKIPVILGSATPTLETLHNVKSGRYRLATLTRRVHDRPAPTVQLVDVRSRPLDHGISQPLYAAIGRHLEAGGQALLFINRRGYAPVLLCHDCGWRAPCRHCDAFPTVHRARGRLVCHHCGQQQSLPARCGGCGSRAVQPAGHGTERVEDGLRAAFPGHRIERFDSDRLRKRGELERLLADIRSGAIHILVGTQLLAKGHDFAGLTLVGILDVDAALFGSDFRALERVGQLVTQVSGRAGRDRRAGEVFLQTHEPGHPMLLRLLESGYGTFCESLLAQRESAGLPPFRHLALLRAESPAQAAALKFLGEAREQLGRPAGLDVLGPVPAPMEKRAGRFRAQILLQSGSRAALQRILAGWVPALAELASARRVRWSVDVDPIDLF